MAAGNYGEILLRVAGRLSAQLPSAELEEIPSARSMLGADRTLSSEDEALVAELRGALARLAAGLSAEGLHPDAERVGAALDGAEMVMRGELMRGKEDRLPSLFPSFVYVVVLPIAEQDRALELAELTERLIEAELRRIDP